jgi:PAS domain-containing protein
VERRQRDLVLIVARSFAAKLAMPTLIADADGELVFFNEAAAGVLGRSLTDVEELPASRWAELFATRTLDADPLPLERMPPGIALLEGRPAHDSLALVGLDGVPRHVAVTAFPLLSRPDELVGIMAIFWELPAAT